MWIAFESIIIEYIYFVIGDFGFWKAIHFGFGDEQENLETLKLGHSLNIIFETRNTRFDPWHFTISRGHFLHFKTFYEHTLLSFFRKKSLSVKG